MNIEEIIKNAVENATAKIMAENERLTAENAAFKEKIKTNETTKTGTIETNLRRYIDDDVFRQLFAVNADKNGHIVRSVSFSENENGETVWRSMPNTLLFRRFYRAIGCVYHPYADSESVKNKKNRIAPMPITEMHKQEFLIYAKLLNDIARRIAEAQNERDNINGESEV